jgi:single-strand DNA-binding protein
MSDFNSLNKVILLGRLGQKPELRVLPQGDRSVAHFSLATNERWTSPKTNESTERTEWHKIVVWGKQAEFCDRYLDKGRQILIEGRLQTRSWQDKDGNKRSTTEIVAQSIVLIGGRREETSEAGPYPDKAPAEFPGEAETAAVGEGEGDDEVPF